MSEIKSIRKFRRELKYLGVAGILPKKTFGKVKSVKKMGLYLTKF